MRSQQKIEVNTLYVYLTTALWSENCLCSRVKKNLKFKSAKTIECFFLNNWYLTSNNYRFSLLSFFTTWSLMFNFNSSRRNWRRGRRRRGRPVWRRRRWGGRRRRPQRFQQVRGQHIQSPEPHVEDKPTRLPPKPKPGHSRLSPQIGREIPLGPSRNPERKELLQSLLQDIPCCYSRTQRRFGCCLRICRWPIGESIWFVLAECVRLQQCVPGEHRCVEGWGS